MRAKNECEVKRRKPRVVLMTNGGRMVKPTAIVCRCELQCRCFETHSAFGSDQRADESW